MRAKKFKSKLERWLQEEYKPVRPMAPRRPKREPTLKQLRVVRDIGRRDWFRRLK